MFVPLRPAAQTQRRRQGAEQTMRDVMTPDITGTFLTHDQVHEAFRIRSEQLKEAAHLARRPTAVIYLL